MPPSAPAFHPRRSAEALHLRRNARAFRDSATALRLPPPGGPPLEESRRFARRRPPLGRSRFRRRSRDRGAHPPSRDAPSFRRSAKAWRLPPQGGPRLPSRHFPEPVRAASGWRSRQSRRNPGRLRLGSNAPRTWSWAPGRSLHGRMTSLSPPCPASPPVGRLGLPNPAVSPPAGPIRSPYRLPRSGVRSPKAKGPWTQGQLWRAPTALRRAQP